MDRFEQQPFSYHNTNNVNSRSIGNEFSFVFNISNIIAGVLGCQASLIQLELSFQFNLMVHLQTVLQTKVYQMNNFSSAVKATSVQVQS